jgi:hypothetical protein
MDLSTKPTLESLHAPSDQPVAGKAAAKLLVCLPSIPSETVQAVLEHLASVFAPDEVLVLSPDLDETQHGGYTPLPIAAYEGPRGQSEWVLTGGDYLGAYVQMERHDFGAALLLGSDIAALPPTAIHQMAQMLASGADLTVPAYALAPHEGLVNSALLYPLTRALFTTNIRFPLAADAGLSRRMAARLAAAAQRPNATSQPSGLLWPVAEAAVGSFSVREANAGRRSLKAPAGADFNALFAEVASSLFADIEAKATFWQRTRPIAASFRSEAPLSQSGDVDDELRSMVDSFRLAHNNLQEIWSLVLPPQSLVALKKLSLSEPLSFSLAPTLWARIVYDFALSFHLRTLNRGHLLGAMTPLYLAWVASTLRAVEDGAAPPVYADYIEETARAFESEKSYFVARWRWPDRFNP